MNVVEQMKQELIQVNRRLAEMELRRDMEALEFFSRYLADHLVFRGANGKLQGKYGQQGFMRTLCEPSPFSALRTEEISIEFVGARALVRLVVAGRSKADGSVHHYRSIRLFSRRLNSWLLEFWYNDEIPHLPQ